jgi:hypothetical protein
VADSESKVPPELRAHVFQVGKSGNPSGRPKGLEARTRELLGGDIDAIVYVQRCVALGVPPDHAHLTTLGVTLSEGQRKALEANFGTITPRHANEAAKLLTDRGWGKAKQHVEIGDRRGPKMPKGMRALTEAELRIAAKLDEGLEGLDDDELEAIDAADPGHGATEH